ncbi:alanine/glycine:cation symporter family protein [Terrisporobacter muris]|uniref:Sodium:alanine symporter family protein n=1 Tax=Terrisporobacter muris TaxID=2963284 RepID=A0A9X2M9M4_9FIRM|nr:sodium:alanine symporter family protein [Terrisporobacter muris]MCR1821905.1 sodium:alanine symporter family protein [Terrisporobacter muris]
MFNLLESITSWLWTYPVLIVLVGGAIIMTFTLRFFQFTKLPFILKQTFGKIFSKSSGDGTISPFQAATSALASTIGASNIVGVPIAIATGGPGAVFWMWLIALFGCSLKYSEIILGIKYRIKNEDGEYVGGPMYYIRDGAKLPWLGTLFAFFLMIEIAPSISTQTASFVQSAATINITPVVSGLFLIAFVGFIVYGGIKRIGKISEKLVPIMATIYMAMVLIVIAVNFEQLPNAFALIFKGAFTPQAGFGGFVGATIVQTIKAGAARGAYSNEAGMGTSTIAHSAAITDHPARQGLWGIFEVIVSTLMICSVSALLVLTTDVWHKFGASNAASMPAAAMQTVFGNTLGGGIITVCMLMFVFSTIVVIIFYGEKQAEYLFGSKFSKIMRVVYLLFIAVGATMDLSKIIVLLDFTLAGVIATNMIGVLLLRKEVKEESDTFFENEKLIKNK